MRRAFLMLWIACLLSVPLHAQVDTYLTYWVNPQTGDDSADGLSQDTALATLTEAWNRIPLGEEIPQGIIINLMAGTYPPEITPNYWESRYGTAEKMIVIQAAEGKGTAILHGANLYDVRHLRFVNVDFIGENDPIHCERCDHFYLGGVTVRGADPETELTREAVKINQSSNIIIIGSDISGANDNPIDFVAVQNALVTGNNIHHSGDWCMYVKGGSANIVVERNRFYDCGVGGFTAGQGTGLEFMEAPYLQYEAYNVRFSQNVVYDTWGAGVGVNGGNRILIYDNLFVNVGERSHLLEVVNGLRSCDGDVAKCQAYIEAGAWGVAELGVEAYIPNQDVAILNNVFYNRAPYESAYQHFAIFAPRQQPAQARNIPDPAVSDAGLLMAGNIIWNGTPEKYWGIEADAGCQASHPTCNRAQLEAENDINTFEPPVVPLPEGGYALGSFLWTKQVALPAWASEVP